MCRWIGSDEAVSRCLEFLTAFPVLESVEDCAIRSDVELLCGSLPEVTSGGIVGMILLEATPEE